MTPPFIKMSELHKLKEKKENIKKISYDRIIELCQRRIRNIASHGGQNTFYEIPGMLVGYPLYNIYDCTNYVVDFIRKNGFIVQILPPPHICVLYISWDHNDLKTSRLAIEPPQPNVQIKSQLKPIVFPNLNEELKHDDTQLHTNLEGLTTKKPQNGVRHGPVPGRFEKIQKKKLQYTF